MDDDRAFNPYAPPRADLRPLEPEPPETPPGEWSAAPYRVPAVNGLMWWWQAGRLFVERPIFWTLVLFVIIEVRQRWGIRELLPYISVGGVSLHMCLVALFGGGAALAAHRQSRAESMRLPELAADFQNRFRQTPHLLLLEPANCLLGFVCMIAAGFAIAFLLQWTDRQDLVRNIGEAALRPAQGMVAIACYAPVEAVMFLLYFFVPAQITLGKANILQALWRTFRAVLRNWLALLLNGLLPTYMGGYIWRSYYTVQGRPLPGALGECTHLLLTATLVLLPLVGYVAARDMFYNEK